MNITGLVDEIGAAADRTPPGRERSVDLVRAAAISFVVVGHWIVIAVIGTGGDVTGLNALGELTWMHPLTWIFQVMPLFFLVGGYANTASIRSHRRRGGSDLEWVIGRVDRIVRPAAALVATLAILVVAARAAGAGAELTAMAAWAATVPLWFLLVYVVVVVLAPIALGLHERFDVGVPIVMVVLVGAADAVRLVTDNESWAAANHLLVWLVAHQLGVLWCDDADRARRYGRRLVAVALLTAVVLVTAGPYPVSMVSTPGSDIDNTSPPTVALLAFALGQCGLVLAARDLLDRVAHRRRTWFVVVAVNSVILTIFVWHMTAAIVVAAVVHGSGLAAAPPLGSGGWLAWRLPWIVASAVVLALLVAAFAALERSVPRDAPLARADQRASPRALLACAATAVAAVSVLGIVLAGSGDDGPLGLPTWSVVGFVAGAVVVARTRQARA